MESNPSHKSFGKTLKKIIRIMQNIGFTTSLDSTTNTPEKIGATIEKWIVSYQLYFMIFQWFAHLYCQDIVMPIFTILKLRTN